jgi:hypothetical protein
MKQLTGVNERSYGDRVIFKHCKCKMIRDNITIKINNVIGWQWQHGFHDK